MFLCNSDSCKCQTLHKYCPLRVLFKHALWPNDLDLQSHFSDFDTGQVFFNPSISLLIIFTLTLHNNCPLHTYSLSIQCDPHRVTFPCISCSNDFDTGQILFGPSNPHISLQQCQTLHSYCPLHVYSLSIQFDPCLHFMLQWLWHWANSLLSINPSYFSAAVSNLA